MATHRPGLIDASRPNPLRALPPVQALLQAAEAGPLLARFGHAAVADALRGALQAARDAIRAGAPAPGSALLLATAAQALAAGQRPVLRRVINATGIVLHTNLGRAPLSAAARHAVMQAAEGYSNLEYDLASGGRGARTQGVEPLLARLTGAEAALAVNNNAAAMLLALSALAANGEVIVSRGELVEIGGGFRIPDIIRQGGARLVEVGTTNKTRLDDYRAAIGPDTRMLLKVHQSNYRIVGFTAAPSMAELAALARTHGLPLMEDLGSGTLVDLRRLGRVPEPTVADSLAGGADLVAFSGDKLLGGPQAGLVVGRAALLQPLRTHPLMRALRLDKLTLAALEGTLRQYLAPEPDIPVLRMLAQDPQTVQARAMALAALLPDRLARVVETGGYAGGGALPADPIPSRALALDAPAGPLAEALRAGTPAVVCRVQDGQVLLDLLAVADEEVPALAAAVREALRTLP